MTLRQKRSYTVTILDAQGEEIFEVAGCDRDEVARHRAGENRPGYTVHVVDHAPHLPEMVEADD